jgi:hypothetical protein
VSRIALAALGLACLGGAVAVGASRGEGRGRDPAAALGGARVLLEDALFLRADAQRRAGDLEEAASAYRRVLEIDPLSETAADHLANVLAYDFRAEATTPEGRLRWWKAAEAANLRALERTPRSPTAHWRRADLLLAPPNQDPVIDAHLVATGHDRRLEALRELAEAARLADDIPRRGLVHLVTFAILAPRLAAERLASGGPGVDEILALGTEIGRLRFEALDSFTFGDRPPPEPSGARRLSAALVLVTLVREDLAASPPRRDDARSLLDAYEAAFGRDGVVEALAPRLR